MLTLLVVILCILTLTFTHHIHTHHTTHTCYMSIIYMNSMNNIINTFLNISSDFSIIIIIISTIRAYIIYRLRFVLKHWRFLYVKNPNKYTTPTNKITTNWVCILNVTRYNAFKIMYRCPRFVITMQIRQIQFDDLRMTCKQAM